MHFLQIQILVCLLQPFEERFIAFIFKEPSYLEELAGGRGEEYLGFELPPIELKYAQTVPVSPWLFKCVRVSGNTLLNDKNSYLSLLIPQQLRSEVQNGLLKFSTTIGSKIFLIDASKIKHGNIVNLSEWNKNTPAWIFYNDNG